MHVTNKLKLDLTKPDLTLSINAVQGDAYSRSLHLSLYVGLQPWTIPENIKVAIRYGKPDHTKGYYDMLPDGTSAWSVDDNTLTIHLAPQMLTVAGMVKTQIELVHGTHILSTFNLTIHVEANPAAGLLHSEDYINWLQWLQEQSEEQVQQIQQSVQEIDHSVHMALQASQTAVQASESAVQASQSAVQATNQSEFFAKQAADIVEKSNAYTKQESDYRYSMIICPAVSGNSISLTDSLSQPLRGLCIYGKTTQSGTPTPEMPVALINSGHNGHIAVTVKDTDDSADAQHLILSTPGGLPGIPVTSGGNYTDENGMQWICDEIDLARGVYLQRIDEIVFDGSDDESWIISSTYQSNQYRYSSSLLVGAVKPPVSNNDPVNVMTTIFHSITAATSGTYGCREGISADVNGRIFCYSNSYNTSDVTLWKKYLSDNPMTVLYERITPTETPLSAEELAAYAALHTYDRSTILSNDVDAGMKVRYAADTQRYIDNKIATLATLVA